MSEPYFRADLARIHDEGFGFHAENCAPGVLALLEPVRQRGGTVLEIGCGSGALSRYLVGAGHRVIATDASPAMLELAAGRVPGAELRPLRLPEDPVPPADAVVGIGHALNYLPDAAAVERALDALAGALRPGGVLALDICDLAWGAEREHQPDRAIVRDDWTIITRFSLPAPDRYVREITTFVRADGDTWRRDDERHDNVLVDVSALAARLAGAGVRAAARNCFGDERLPAGLLTLVGTKG